MVGRATKTKKQILKCFEANHLLSAKDLQRLIPEVDQATIYRNLKKFMVEGVIREVHLGKECSYYELSRDDHQHFLCKKCGRIEEIALSTERIKKLLPSNFKLTNLELNARGICNICR